MANTDTAELTQKEQHQRNLERLEKMRPIDYDFSTACIEDYDLKR